jgi:hypothetical protein
MAEMCGASDNATEQRCRNPQENRREDSDRLSARNDQSPEPTDHEPDQRPPQQNRREAEGSPTDDRQDHDRRNKEKQKHHDCPYPTRPRHTPAPARGSVEVAIAVYKRANRTPAG